MGLCLGGTCVGVSDICDLLTADEEPVRVVTVVVIVVHSIQPRVEVIA